MTRGYFAEVNKAVWPILSALGQNAADVLAAAFRAKDGKFVDVEQGTLGGAELLDAGFSIAGDIAAEGEAAIRAKISDWIRRRLIWALRKRSRKP